MHQSTPPSSFKSFVVSVSLLAAALAAGCGASRQSSSSTNWLQCQSDADCAAVVGAVCRSDRTCIDKDGQPVPASAADPSRSGAGGQGGAGDPHSPATDGGNESGAGATAGGAPANMAGSAGVDGCPAGPPRANTACSPEGLVCQYAGSSVGLVATCTGGTWVTESGGGDPSYVCPGVLPDQGSNCPKPPTPAYSPLVCLFDRAHVGCQNGSGCGAFQANCVEDPQSGGWQWSSMPRFSCTI